MQSKHNVLKIVDVSLLTSFYHSIEKKAKILEILFLYHSTDYAKGTNSHIA